MSNELMEFLGEQKSRFMKLDKAQLLDFQQECLFARQQIMKQDFTYKVASANPASLQAAILNVAAIGISLNPAQAHAYLVPRDKAICLDISYKGLVKLATDCGALRDCKSILVYESDSFAWCGPYEMPKHEADVFGERGKVVGAYNIAYLPDGRVMVDTMSMAEILKVQNTSKAQNGPWKTWWEEMAKKTMTKRAYKSWPQTNNRERLDKAVQVLHDIEGMAYTINQQNEYMGLLRAGDGLAFYLHNHLLPENTRVALFNSFADGHKVADKKRANDLESEGCARMAEIIEGLAELIDKNDTDGISEYRDDFSEEEWEFVIGMLAPDRQSALDQVAA